MLGGLTVRQGDRTITQFRTHKTGALLAYLAFHSDRAHPREELIALLWPESDLDAGRPSLSVALSSLRHQLEPPGVPAGAVLIASRTTVQINPEFCETDVSQFNTAIQRAAACKPEEELQIGIALEAYRGELLPGYYEDWCLAERERLADKYLHALRLRVKHLAKSRNLPAAIDCARLAVQANPLCEASHRDLMRLYNVVGRPSAALHHFQLVEERFRAEVGSVPAAATRRLAREIAAGLEQGTHPSDIGAAYPDSELAGQIPPLRTIAAPPIPAAAPDPQAPFNYRTPHDSERTRSSSLPYQFTRFFGRDSEIAFLTNLLAPASCKGTDTAGDSGSGWLRSPGLAA